MSLADLLPLRPSQGVHSGDQGPQIDPPLRTLPIRDSFALEHLIGADSASPEPSIIDWLRDFLRGAPPGPSMPHDVPFDPNDFVAPEPQMPAGSASGFDGEIAVEILGAAHTEADAAQTIQSSVEPVMEVADSLTLMMSPTPELLVEV